MKVYEATVIDKCASPSGEEPASFESYIAVGTGKELAEGSERASRFLPAPYVDEQIHCYFTESEFTPVEGELDASVEFKYLVGERIA